MSEALAMGYFHMSTKAGLGENMGGLDLKAAI
jgi:hypothetical protein